jgi:hypothetical protein
VGQVTIPNQILETKLTGYQIPANLTYYYVIFSINGVVYPNGLRINYSSGYRNIYPTVDENRNVVLNSICLAYGETIPEYTISQLEVLIIG